MTQNAQATQAAPDELAATIDEQAWQQATDEEDRRFWQELEPNLQPLIAESIRRIYLRHVAVRRFRSIMPLGLETFVGSILVDGLDRMGRRLEADEEYMRMHHRQFRG